MLLYLRQSTNRSEGGIYGKRAKQVREKREGVAMMVVVVA